MQIENHCTKPPWGLVWHVRRSLAWINPADVDGVSCVQLVDQLPKPSSASPVAIREAFEHGFNIYGLYRPRDKTKPPYITLNIADIYKAVPRLYWFTTVPTLLVTHSLAHEVGHHIVAKRGYIIKPGETGKLEAREEAFANQYAFSVYERMQRRWYYRLGGWAIRDLSEWHYVFGMISWKSKNYIKAAEHWYNASVLNPDNNDAAHWYRRAKEMRKT